MIPVAIFIVFTTGQKWHWTFFIKYGNERPHKKGSYDRANPDKGRQTGKLTAA